CASVTSTAAPPMRAGLVASTVTPTSTAPVLSFTNPRIPPEAVCAEARPSSAVARKTAHSVHDSTPRTRRDVPRMVIDPSTIENAPMQKCTNANQAARLQLIIGTSAVDAFVPDAREPRDLTE